MNKYKEYLPLTIVACVTIGLAPFFPEPHIIGKLRWVFGGGVGMGIEDYFDLIMHGLPWLVLIVLLIGMTFKSNKNEKIV